MLQLKNITKDYITGNATVNALNGVSINFRDSEFVSVLGASGCGKTTLLNIIGGLDRYTQGDLIIDGVSTKDYTDRDWDNYRNHSIGFVFQSYNLIMHQSVLSNVELALTLSGISKEERKKRAVEALEKVGLKDQIHKMPNQLSGGQMQRVAIARAIVNNPKIILADEPTGALDTKTSVQIMDLLKEISKDKLIIMVTHNPELANDYSTRIINLKDGQVQNDSMPYDVKQPKKDAIKATVHSKQDKKPRMSFFTAIALSLKNLITKKTRTLLTAFAGSLGIIGIALILAVSSGFQNYIDKLQVDALSGAPVTIYKYSQMADNILGAAGSILDSSSTNKPAYPNDKTITANPALSDVITAITNSQKTNNLKDFKVYLENNIDRSKVINIAYDYNVSKTIYSDPKDGRSPKNLNTALTSLINSIKDEQTKKAFNTAKSIISTTVWSEMIENRQLIQSQFDLICGKYSEQTSATEIMIVVDKYNQINDYVLFMLGLKDTASLLYNATYNSLKEINATAKLLYETMPDKYNEFVLAYLQEEYGITYNPATDIKSYDMEKDILGKTFRIVPNAMKYVLETDESSEKYNYYVNKEVTDEYWSDENNFVTVKVTGILRRKKNVNSASISGTAVYNKALTDKLIQMINASPAITAQLNSPTTSVLDGQKLDSSSTAFQDALNKLGYVDTANPNKILLYPNSFEDKDYISRFIKTYNSSVNKKSDEISYSDYYEVLMSSIGEIIKAISIVLICFVGISLVVSSIMIGIITYISVLERTKEIGILRSLGASKRDVGKIFNAETLIVGFIAGIIGILLALILCLPVNAIIHSLVPALIGIAKLPAIGALILIGISVILTAVSGLIPSSIAAKKDPVVALRTE